MTFNRLDFLERQHSDRSARLAATAGSADHSRAGRAELLASIDDFGGYLETLTGVRRAADHMTRSNPERNSPIMNTEILDGLERRAQAWEGDASAILDKADRESRSLTDDERARFDSLTADISDLRSRIGKLRQGGTERSFAFSEITPSAAGLDVRVNSEPLTYHPERRSVSFVRDLITSQLGDYAAQDRLARHAREMEIERRDIGTSALAGVVPPAYLTDLVAELARAGRPTANLVRHHPLPETGMTAEISRVTTGTSAASQATQNAAVSETDADDTLLSVPVVTIAGQQDVSRQAIERGVGVDELIFGDLAGAYATELDRQILVAGGTSGTHLGVSQTVGINSVTYTDVSPTFSEFWPKLADAANRVTTGIYRPADLVIMHPRRWAWFLAQVDTTGRPVVDSTGDRMNPLATASETGGVGVVGRMLNMDVVVDANIPTNLGAGTNEDIVIVAHRGELHLWEDGAAPMTIRAEGVGAGSLTVKLVVYGYSAFTAGRRPTASSVIGGTGLVTPSF